MDIENAIVLLHSKWLTNRKIAFEIWMHHRTVASYLLKKWLLSNGSKPMKLNTISDSHAVCSKCNWTYTIEEFQFVRTNWWRISYCNKCRKIQSYERVNLSIDSFMKDKYARLKVRSKKYKIPFEISYDDFISQYKYQWWKCFYSWIDLVCASWSWRHRNSLSVDKIIPELGYIKSNLVFCTTKVNTCKSDISLDEMKEWMPWWYEKVKMWREAWFRCLQVQEGNF